LPLSSLNYLDNNGNFFSFFNLTSKFSLLDELIFYVFGVPDSKYCRHHERWKKNTWIPQATKKYIYADVQVVGGIVVLCFD